MQVSNNYKQYLDLLDAHFDEMKSLIFKWSEINSHSLNVNGLAQIRQELHSEFKSSLEPLVLALQDCSLEIKEIELNPEQTIAANGQSIALPLGKALSIRKCFKEPAKRLRVLLVGHMDTVFPVDSHFQNVKELDANTLNGPGVADLKGGLTVMLKALMAFEQSPYADKIEWEILINPDEEIGSPGSSVLLELAAKRNDLGLVYEPSLADGSLAYTRKGAGNFVFVAHGKAAHVGREFAKGASAVVAIADLVQRIHALNDNSDIIANTGKIEGGGPTNVVPDLAIARVNIRTQSINNELWVEQEFAKIISIVEEKYRVKIEQHGRFNRKPKNVEESEENKKLFTLLETCTQDLGLPFKLKDTGGCCDGNNLFEAGLPNIDTLGVRGGSIHSDQEFVLLDSLLERAKLSALLLMKLANTPGF